MFQILLTGDVHLGRSYQKEPPQLAERLSSARFEALENAVAAGNREGCRFLVIAGDLYDRVSAIPVEYHKRVAAILGEFEGHVLVLPGNHDYLSAEGSDLWHKFQEHSPSNTFLFRENSRKVIDGVAFYGCICHDKHSAQNALGWLREQPPAEDGLVHIGIAHGAIEGLSYDAKQQYYTMTEAELLGLPMDAWLIGHTHVAYPAADAVGCRIFNAGTPQQTDIADNSRGEAFVLQVADDRSVACRRVRTGVVDFVRRDVSVAQGEPLADKLSFPGLEGARTVLRLHLTGVLSPEEYESRQALYRCLEDSFLKLEVEDAGLRRAITPAMIDQETMPGTRINQLLKHYAQQPELLDLAYELVLACKGGK